MIITDSSTQHDGQDQRRHAGTDMDNNTTGKIKSPQIFHPASCCPNPMRQRIINKCCPQNSEKQEGRKFHPFRISTDNQSRSNNGEHRLKDHKNTVWDSRGVIRIRQGAYTSESCPIQIADYSVKIRAEGQRITEQNPLDRKSTRLN